MTENIRGEMERCRLLLVEDEPLYLEFIEQVVRDLGIRHIETAGDGREALAITRGADEFDLVICDWKMPNMDGLAFLKQYRKLFPRAKFLFMTSRDSLEDVLEATQAGAANFLSKPVLVGELQSEVVSMLTWHWPLKGLGGKTNLSMRYH
jgi:CheY-like chemotaxis protein